MNAKGHARLAGKVLTTSRPCAFLAPSGVICSQSDLMSSSMLPNQNRPWKQGVGVRFSPKREPTALYPQLDMARFLSTSSIDTTTSARRGEGELTPGLTNLLMTSSVPGELAKTSENQEFPSLLSDEELDLLSSELGLDPPSLEDATLLQDGSDKELPTKEENNEPPLTSLDFNISSELFHAARTSAAGSAKSFWSHTMYQGVRPDGTIRKVKVHYCTSKHTMEHVCQKYFLNESVLGFDLEWLAYATRKSGPRENVSLIQLASPSRIGLFHVALFPKSSDLVTPTFRKIMEDPNVSKVGVHIQGDCTRLKNYLGVSTRGIFELSHLYKLVKFLPQKRQDLINKVPVALSTQVLDHLRLPLYKGQSVRSSNWMKPLDESQLKYSAADAYAGIQLYHVMDEKRKALEPSPPRPHHAELGLPIPIPEVPSDESAGDDGVAPEPAAAAESSPVTPRRKLKVQKSTTSRSVDKRDARITTAELKAKTYRSSKRTTVSTSPSALRAYYIWHGHDDLKPEAVAKLLRDPPLQTNTVITYILDAIAAEKLPYSRQRLKFEILSLLRPAAASSKKYKTLVADCQSLAS